MARAAAVTEIDARALQADPLYLVAAPALCGVVRVNAAFASLGAGADDGLVTLDLDDVPPFHGLVTLAVSGFGAHRVAVAVSPAVAIIEDIAPFFRGSRCLNGHPQE